MKSLMSAGEESLYLKNRRRSDGLAAVAELCCLRRSDMGGSRNARCEYPSTGGTCPDGDYNNCLDVGDQIVIHQAKKDCRILKLGKLSFLEILRKKMQSYH